MTTAARSAEQGRTLCRNLKRLAEEEKIDDGPRPTLATSNCIMLSCFTAGPGSFETIPDPTRQAWRRPTTYPSPDHNAMLAYYHKGESLIETLPRNSRDALTMALTSPNGKAKNISPTARSLKHLSIDHDR
jgi:hypothetical protein